MVKVNVKEMLEAGAHFGHQTRFWNPGMKPYIYGARNGIHIIDLQKTLDLCQQACQFIARVVSEGGDLLFVGTKKQAQSIIEEEAKRCQMSYVSRRWLGGTLTNYRTIKASIDRFKNLEKKFAEGGFEVLTKKERLGVERDLRDLAHNLGGIKEMTRLPSALFLVDVSREKIAREEANRLGIPVVALADTNCDPRGIDYLVPANDDALKSIRLFCHKIADACLEGISRRDAVIREKAVDEETATSLAKEFVVGEKGHAFVSQPEKYDEAVDGEFSKKAHP